MKISRAIFAFLLLFITCFGLNADEIGLVFVPNTPTAVTTKTTRVYYMKFTNTTGGAVTVTVSDRSTNCNSGACDIWTAVSIPANTTITEASNGVLMNGGITWSASAANSITGWMYYYAGAPGQATARGGAN